ncbi:MAG: 50S ribosomal protein L15 [Solitalea-like symbiont of Acarus siro]
MEDYLSALRPALGSIKKSKRIGRGQASGKGGTSTKGHKGAQSRSGYKFKLGFEGGQMPLQRRIPKYGFKNINKILYKLINLDELDKLANKHVVDKIDFDFLVKVGLVNKNDKVKLLGNGKLTKAIEVIVHKSSGTAAEAVQKAGGKLTLL